MIGFPVVMFGFSDVRGNGFEAWIRAYSHRGSQTGEIAGIWSLTVLGCGIEGSGVRVEGC
jgi:hypothetical protein